MNVLEWNRGDGVYEKFIDKLGESKENRSAKAPLRQTVLLYYASSTVKSRKQIRAYGGCLGSQRLRRTW